jgi:uncharacterized membrane protein
LLAAAALSPIASHAALLSGRGFAVALPLAMLQAVAVGVFAAGMGGHDAGPAQRRRNMVFAWVLSAVLLVVLGVGALLAPGEGLQVAAGLTHATLYTALLLTFGATLLPGRTEMVTGIAMRFNPRFHAGMRFYTRRVTWAWCGCFAAELAISGLLLALAPLSWWLVFINFLHVPLLGAMFGAEYLVRRRMFPA